MAIRRLCEVALIERAKAGKVYESGATLITLSAVIDEVFYHAHKGKIDSRYAVVIPNDGITPYYLYETIGMSFQKFLVENKTGINLQIGMLDDFLINVTENMDEQKKIADFCVQADGCIDNEKKIVNALRDLKDYMLDGMFI